MLHRLTEALGLIPGDEGDALPPRSRAALKAIGVKAGRFGLFLPALLKPRAGAMRALLWACRTAAGARTAAAGSGVAAAASRIGRPGSPTRWAGCRPARCCCASTSPSGSPRNWPGRRGAAADRAAGRSGVALLAEGGSAAGGAAAPRLPRDPGGGLAAESTGPPAPAMIAAAAAQAGRAEPARRPGARAWTVRRPGGLRSADGSSAIADQEDRDWQRLDKWLWCARFMQARSRLRRAWWPGPSASTASRPTSRTPGCASGDVLTVPVHGSVRVVRVLSLAARRGPAPEAQMLYEEIGESRRSGPCA